MTPYRCPLCGRPRLLDTFAGEGGAGEGYRRAGFCVTAVDTNPARLKRYPIDCAGAHRAQGDAIGYILANGAAYAAIHASPTCTGYSRGTAAIPDRVAKYDRLIPAVREALQMVGRPYVIENVFDARSEMCGPLMLCGRMFGLTAVDDDQTPLVLDRHRMFETSWFVPLIPQHDKHDPTLQVAGAYGGGRRDKHEARHVRKGGYVPRSPQVIAALLGITWMTQTGLKLSVPPVYTKWIGEQLIAHLEGEVAA